MKRTTRPVLSILMLACLVGAVLAWADDFRSVSQFWNKAVFHSDVNIKDDADFEVESTATMTVGGTATFSGTVNLSTFTATGGSLTLKGAEAGDATLYVQSDEGDDAGDQWQIAARAATNRLEVKCGGTNLVTITSAGAVSIKGTTTLATTLSGILKATSGVVSAAGSGTDYLAPGAASFTNSISATITNLSITVSKGLVTSVTINGTTKP